MREFVVFEGETFERKPAIRSPTRPDRPWPDQWNGEMPTMASHQPGLDERIARLNIDIRHHRGRRVARQRRHRD